MTPRTKAGADLFIALADSELDEHAPTWPDMFERRVRAIEDEMLDKVAAAVDGLGLYPAATPAGPRTPEQDGYNRATDDVLAAIERIRRDDDGRA